MNIKKHFWTIVSATVLIISSSTTYAQAADRGTTLPNEKGAAFTPPSPEQTARQTTQRMDSILHLTKKQYDKIYKLNLKWARKDLKNQSETHPKGDRREGPQHFGGGKGVGPGPRGNRPPEGMDRRPPRDFSKSNDREKMEKQRKKREKKLKKILSEEQFPHWMHVLYPVRPHGKKEERK